MDFKRILLVEDNSGDARLMQELLIDSGSSEFHLETVESVSDALDRLNKNEYDLILLDLSLPDGTGLDTVRRICGNSPHTPVVVLTGLEDEILAVKAIQTGAQDYLVKGQVSGIPLIRALRYAIERKRAEELLNYQANHDALTGLPNLRLFRDRAEHAVERARRCRYNMQEKCSVAIVVIDLDLFKLVNDSLGHTGGDRLLKAVAKRLTETIRNADTVARVGGDEFSLVLEGLTDRPGTEITVERISGVFTRPFLINQTELKVTASLGVALFPDDGDDPENLIMHADYALYRAKETRNCCRFYQDVG
jgi:two-component system cell cycle response regulator